MTDWHDVVPALNSLLITLSIYVFLLLNVEIRNRIRNLETRRDATNQAPEARRKRQDARNPVPSGSNSMPSSGNPMPSASGQAPEDGSAKDGGTPDIAKQPHP